MRRVVISLVLAVCSLFTHAAEFDKRKIILAADIWCPINCIAQSEHEGIMIEIAKAIFARHGVEVEYRIIPWSRAIKLAAIGKIDGIVGAYHGDAPDFIFPEVEQIVLTNSIFTLKPSQWMFDQYSSLPDILLGAISAYDYGEEMNAYINNPENYNRIQLFYGETPLDGAFNLLIRRRIDALVETDLVFLYKAKQLNMLDKIAHRFPISAPQKAFIAFSNQKQSSITYAQWLSDGMQILRDSGELQLILNKYGIEDWQ